MSDKLIYEIDEPSGEPVGDTRDSIRWVKYRDADWMAILGFDGALVLFDRGGDLSALYHVPAEGNGYTQGSMLFHGNVADGSDYAEHKRRHHGVDSLSRAGQAEWHHLPVTPTQKFLMDTLGVEAEAQDRLEATISIAMAKLRPTVDSFRQSMAGDIARFEEQMAELLESLA